MTPRRPDGAPRSRTRPTIVGANLLRGAEGPRGTLESPAHAGIPVFDDPHFVRDGAPDDSGAGEAVADEPVQPLARVRSLREVQRARIEAEAQRLVRFESQLANLQLILKADQARLAIDRLRFAVHGLCGSMSAADRVDPAAEAPERRIVRVK